MLEEVEVIWVSVQAISLKRVLTWRGSGPRIAIDGNFDAIEMVMAAQSTCGILTCVPF